MTERLSPGSNPEDHLPDVARGASEPAPAGGRAPAPQRWRPDPEDEGLDLNRYLQALLRHKWLIALATLLGVAAGFVVTRFIPPEYEAGVTLWIETEGGTGAEGPIRPGELLEDYAWADLLESYVVLDPVVMDKHLYLNVDDGAAAALFEGFDLDRTFVPGTYKVRVSATGDRVTLARASGEVVETAARGEPLGREAGFHWTPPGNRLAPGSTAQFTVKHPRDVSRWLANELRVSIDGTGSFLTMTMRGENPEVVADILNSVADRYLEVAARLKRHRLDEEVRILREQLEYARENLEQAEDDLESFRVETVALPSQPGASVAAGLQETRDPVFGSYFEMRVELEDMRRDRQSLERALAEARQGSVRVEALEAIPAVRNSSELMRVLDELSDAKSERRELLNRYTERAPPVQEITRRIDEMEARTIPRLLQSLVNELDSRRASLDELVESVTTELRQVPPRAIQEANLERRVNIADNFYQNLRSRFEEAQLASASTIPDIQILDYAHVPSEPTRDDAPRFFLLAVMAGLGLGASGALLLGHVDRKLRHPDEIEELGLPILGTVPRVRKRRGRIRPEDEARLVEALRSIRLNLTHAYGTAGPMVLAVTSPGQGDGKSFVASNLAVAFAELGQRTLLVDADVRRGSLHRFLATERRPGLTDLLASEVHQRGLIRATEYDLLEVLPSGTRHADAPERLASPAMRELLGSLRARYGVIIVDSPPLSAAVDPLVLSTLTGNLLLVLRSGASDRISAESKLEMVDRLPIRVLGAVMNDLPLNGQYRYYAYLPDYGSVDDEAGGDGGGRRTVVAET